MKNLLLTFLAAVILSSTPTEIKTDHFIVRFDGASSETAKLAAQAAESARIKVENTLGITIPYPVLIQVVSSNRPFGKDQPAGPDEVPDWAVGTAYPARRMIFLRQPTGVRLGYGDVAEVTTHEYVHVAVGYYLGEIETPHWFEEGIADFIGGERSWTASATIGTAAITGKLIPFDMLDSYWPDSAQEADLAYAQASDFVNFIESEYGAGTMKRVLIETKSGGDFIAAVGKVTGKTLTALEDDWLKHATRMYRWIPLFTGGISIWTFASLLVIIGYFRKRRLGRLKMQMWETEEKLARLNSSRRRKIEENNDENNSSGTPLYH